MCSQPISLKQLFSCVCKCTGLATCLFKRVGRMFLMWASAGFHRKSAYNNTFLHEFIFLNDSYVLLRLYQDLTQLNLVTIFMEKSTWKNEINVHMLGPITWFIAWIFPWPKETKIWTCVPHPPDFLPYHSYSPFHCWS